MSDPGYEPTQVNMPPVTPPAGQPPADATVANAPVGPGGPGGPGDLPPGGTPPPPPPDDKRPLIIGGIIAAIIAVVVLLLLLGGDDGDDEAGDTTTTSSTSTSTSTSSTTTTSTSTTTSTTAPTTTTSTTAPPDNTVDPALCRADGSDGGDPNTPAQTVMAAWIRGDELCAAELMTPAARTDLFSRDGEGAQETFQGCGEGPDDETTDCAFTHPGGATHFFMQFNDGWRVIEVEQTAD